MTCTSEKASLLKLLNGKANNNIWILKYSSTFQETRKIKDNCKFGKKERKINAKKHQKIKEEL